MQTLVRLNSLVKAQDISERIATPHRLFDVDSIRQKIQEEDPLVLMQLVFVEFSNTGIRSALERFHCAVLDGSGQPTEIGFAVDLIEGLADIAATNHHTN